MRRALSLLGDFSPSWFAMVMGTGVFATSTHIISENFEIPWLSSLFNLLVAFNFIAFLSILFLWLLHLSLFPAESKEELRHPVRGNFYVMVGIAGLALSLNLSLFGLQIPALALWIFSSLFVIIVQMLLMFLTFVGERVRLEHINPVWFLGTTGLLLIPSVGVSMMPGEINSYYLLIFDYAFGTGFLFYLSLLAIWLYRFILHEPLKGEFIPLFWINMGPIGAAMTSLMTYFHIHPEEMSSALFFALIFLGFGTWWFVMSVMVTIYYARNVKFSYRSVWWSFTFPLGQFLVGTLYLNEYISYESLGYYSLILYSTLGILWTLNIILTAKSLLRGIK